jgi:hypothetical protein
MWPGQLAKQGLQTLAVEAVVVALAAQAGPAS